MNFDKIKRYMELRGFCALGNPNIQNDVLLKRTEGEDAEQWAKDYVALNAQVISFKKKYPELYSLKSFDHCEVNESKPKFPKGKKVIKTDLTNEETRV